MEQKIEEIPQCKIFSQSEYDLIDSNIKRNTTELNDTDNIYLTLNIKIPFDIRNQHLFSISASPLRLEKDYTLYVGEYTNNIKLPFPKSGNDWPEGYNLDILMFLPEKNTVCSWGGEELLILENKNSSTEFDIELLPYISEDDSGARRRTKITPKEI